MRDLVSRLTIVAFLAAVPAALSAQPGPVSSPVKVELSPVAGALVPLSTLIEASEATENEDVDLSEALVYGGNAALHLPGGLGLEIQGLFAPGTETESGDGSSADASYRVLTGGLTYRLAPPGIDRVVDPFVGIGGGVRHFSLDEDETSPGEERPEEDDFVATLQLGTYLTLGSLTLRAEVRDYISSFGLEGTGDSILQNDLAALLGVAFRFP